MDALSLSHSLSLVSCGRSFRVKVRITGARDESGHPASPRVATVNRCFSERVRRQRGRSTAQPWDKNKNTVVAAKASAVEW